MAAAPEPYRFFHPGSVCGVQPRERQTLAVTEGRHGWFAYARTGDGSKPGSLQRGAGGFKTAEEAFAWLVETIKPERLTTYG